MSIEVIKSSNNQVYLDYNATTPTAQFITEKIPIWLQEWANPSSVHQSAQNIKSLLTQAREQVAEFIKCNPLEIVFTSGGSESNNHAIQGLCEKFINSDRKIILTSSVEHSSVVEPLKKAEKMGFKVICIPVDEQGQISIQEYEKHLSDKVAFISIMYVNNETGCIFSIKKLVQKSKPYGILFHCDAIQALGKIPIHTKELDVDLLSLSGHKFYSLKGSGVLFIKKGLTINGLILGGPQERKRRSGTENTLAHLSMGAVCARGEEFIQHGNESILRMRDEMELKMKESIPDIFIIGQNTPRVFNSTSTLIKGVNAETLMMRLDQAGFSVSVSSACHSGSLSPSKVLLGMGYSIEDSKSILRVSIGGGTTKKDLSNYIHHLTENIEYLRALPNEYNLDKTSN